MREGVCCVSLCVCEVGRFVCLFVRMCVCVFVCMYVRVLCYIYVKREDGCLYMCM